MAVWLSLVFSVVLIHPGVWITAAAQKEGTHVEAAIYQLSQSKWDSGVGDEYKKLVIAEANNYCSSSPMECGLKYWNTSNQHKEFMEKDFDMSDGYPSYKKPYLNVSYSLKFPDNVAVDDDAASKVHVEKSALTDISKNMQAAFTEATSYRVLKMDGESFKLPPNLNINIIMIVVGVVLFIACLVLLVVLRYSCRHAHEPVPISEKEVPYLPKNSKKSYAKNGEPEMNASSKTTNLHAHKPEPVEKLKVDTPETENMSKKSSKDNLQNTGV